MAFINLRRKKRIYLEGGAQGRPVSLPPSPSISLPPSLSLPVPLCGAMRNRARQSQRGPPR